MAGIKLAYRLTSLTVDFSGDNASIKAKINPEIELIAKKIPIVEKGPKTTSDDAPALTSYFRAVSLAEFENIKAGGELNIRTKEMREGPPQALGGEYCVTSNMEYSRQLATTKKGEQEGNLTPEQLSYAILLEIETEGPVVDELASTPEYGRVQQQQVAGGKVEPDPLGRPFQKRKERGVIVVKRERVESGASNVNYMILSKTPSDPADPINKINQKVRRISVVGAVKGVKL